MNDRAQGSAMMDPFPQLGGHKSSSFFTIVDKAIECFHKCVKNNPNPLIQFMRYLVYKKSYKIECTTFSFLQHIQHISF